MKQDRIYNNIGFALTELIVVIALIGIVLAIATLNFKEWQDKARIESNLRELHTDITQLRQRSMTHKIEHNITINGNNYVFRQFSSAADNGLAATSIILNKTFSYNLTDTSGNALNNLILRFDERGYATNVNTIVVGPLTSTAAVNCMRVHNSRTNLGKMNGGTCEFH